MIQGNIIAALALVGWPIMAIVLFKLLPPGRALLANILISYLFLPPVPAGFDPPLFPALNKETIPNAMIIVGALFLSKHKIEWLPRNGVARGLVIVFILSPILTVLTNMEPINFGRVWLPGLNFGEAIALCIQQALFLAPFLLARHFLCNEDSQRDLMIALVLGGLIYTIPALLEVRLSPQLNAWVYGFYQHSFEQTVRFGGYRPLVFLYHGIWLAFFLMTSVLAAAALLRAPATRNRVKYVGAALYLAVVLFLCKSAGSLLFAALLIPMILMFSQQLQLNVATVLAVFALSYPMLRQADMIPTEPLLQQIEQASMERANSLRFRFDNEVVLLDRAYIKPVLGWGTWGRNHILDGWDGSILTVTDGRWIIVIGMFGWLGFLAEFGLMAWPILFIWWKGPHPKHGALSPYVGPMALMLGINMIDLIPNATITPLTWLFAGAMLGYAEKYSPIREIKQPVVFNTVMR